MKSARLLFCFFVILALMITPIMPAMPAVHADNPPATPFPLYEFATLSNGTQIAFIPGQTAGSYTLVAGKQFFAVSPAGSVPTPEPLTGLAANARDWVSLIPVTNRSQAKTLGDAFAAVSAQIAAGTLKTADAVTAASKEANRAALGDAGATAWMPWFNQLQTYLAAEAKAGRLTKPEELQAAWSEISKGLRAVQ